MASFSRCFEGELRRFGAALLLLLRFGAGVRLAMHHFVAGQRLHCNKMKQLGQNAPLHPSRASLVPPLIQMNKAVLIIE